MQDSPHFNINVASPLVRESFDVEWEKIVYCPIPTY